MSKKEEKKEEKKASSPATPEEEAAKGKKKKLIAFAIIGLLAVGGGAFAAMKILGGSSKPKDEKPEGEHGAAAAEGDASGHADGEKGGAHGEAKKEESKKDDHGGGHGEAKKDDHGGGHGDGAKPAAAEAPSRYAGIGLMYDFKPFHLNLGNPLENRYVRMEIRLEYPNEEQKTELTARDSQLRDAIVSIVGRKTREHLLSPDGKDQLRLEIKNRVNQYLEKGITNVFITDILIE